MDTACRRHPPLEQRHVADDLTVCHSRPEHRILAFTGTGALVDGALVDVVLSAGRETGG